MPWTATEAQARRPPLSEGSSRRKRPQLLVKSLLDPSAGGWEQRPRSQEEGGVSLQPLGEPVTREPQGSHGGRSV